MTAFDSAWHEPLTKRRRTIVLEFDWPCRLAQPVKKKIRTGYVCHAISHTLAFVLTRSRRSGMLPPSLPMMVVEDEGVSNWTITSRQSNMARNPYAGAHIITEPTTGKLDANFWDTDRPTDSGNTSTQSVSTIRGRKGLELSTYYGQDAGNAGMNRVTFFPSLV